MARFGLFLLFSITLFAQGQKSAVSITKTVAKHNKVTLFFLVDEGQGDNISGFFVYRKEVGKARAKFARVNKRPLRHDRSFYIDRSIKQATVYEYYIEPLAVKKGVKLASSKVVSVTTRSLQTLPVKPTDLKIGRLGESAVILRWLNYEFVGKKGTDVFMRVGISAPFKKLNRKPVKGDSDRVKLRNRKKRHYCYLVAIGAKNKKSPRSNMISYRPGQRQRTDNYVFRAPGEPPGQPQGVVAKYMNTYVQLRWLPQFDSNLKGYKVYRGNFKQGPWRFDGQVGKLRRPVCDSKGVALRIQVCYQVRAVNVKDKEGKASKPVCIRTPNPKPTPMSGLEATVQGKNVLLEWNGFDEKDLEGFYIYYKIRGDKRFKKTKLIKKSSFSYLFKKPKRNKTYVFYGTSYNEYSEESEKSEEVEVFVY